MNERSKQKERILLVANFDSNVGFAWWLMENFWREISLHFSKIGLDSILIYPKISTIPPAIESSPIDVLELDLSSKDLKSLLKLLTLIMTKNVKYVYVSDRAYLDWRYFFMRMVGVKKIINHDHTPGERPAAPAYKKAVKSFLHSLGIFSCDLYIGVSRFVAKRAVDTACVPKDRCLFIHNGIQVFDNSPSHYAHEQFCIPRSKKIIVSTGRATYYKGIDLLIKSAHVLTSEKGYNDLCFLHVGDGPNLQEFKELAASLGLGNNFVFAGFRNDIARILPSCHIAIQASQGEAFSLSVIEYLCAGLPTLAPDNCGNSEAIENGVTGLLFVPGDINDIVAKLSHLAYSPQIARMKDAARRSVLEKFTIQKCNEKLLSVLCEQFGSQI